jgi:photosystem II stability/assembly factor-like uncharacterized protein
MKARIPLSILFAALSGFSQSSAPIITSVPQKESLAGQQNRRMLVGPDYKQPRPYPGYAGFVGWTSVVRTRTGALLMAFSSGYWHASPPTPLVGIKPEDLTLWTKKYGMPILDAPRGGRIEIMRSDDGGKSWSDPTTMIDTQWDDRSPVIASLPDGTLVAAFFTYTYEAVAVIRSFDDGRTWEQTPRYIQAPFHSLAINTAPLVMPDGSLLLAAYGNEKENDPFVSTGIFSSRDRGASWQHLATLHAPHALDEPGLARLPDGTLVVITRPEGAISWSKDGGHTWTAPVDIPVRMFAPWLMTLRDGTLLCLHGSYHKAHHGLRAIVSKDGGRSWTAGGPDFGFPVDASVYGYSSGTELPDGSVYVVFQGTGGHKPADARTMALYGMRLRVSADGRSVKTLPAPGGLKVKATMKKTPGPRKGI